MTIQLRIEAIRTYVRRFFNCANINVLLTPLSPDEVVECRQRQTKRGEAGEVKATAVRRAEGGVYAKGKRDVKKNRQVIKQRR